MLVRRLIVIFVVMVAAVALLAVRLGQLQIAQAVHWQTEARTFIDRPHLVETTRGTIVDCNDRPVAIDTACYDLAIDYRAMSWDDRWITQLALDRLKAEGITDRAERRAKLAAYKARVNDQIETIPAAIARVCGISTEELHARMDAIRARMQLLRQSRWSQQYDRHTDAENVAAGAYDLDTSMNFKEELIAHTIVPAVTDEAAFYFKKHLEDYPGLVIVDAKHRSYPYGDVAAHAIGVMRRVDQKQLDAEPFVRDIDDEYVPPKLHGYLPMDRMGGSGVERMAEAELRGSRGIRVIDIDTDQVIQTKSCAALPGQNIKLTLDIELQKDIETALKDANRHLLRGMDGQNHPVALVILNAADSTVLSMVSLPGFDLNTYDDHVLELMHDQVNHPLLNRVVQSAYPPGSTAKGVVATAALTEKVVTPQDTIVCNGHLFPNQPGIYRCWYYADFGATHGPLHLENALEQSCNIYFYTMGMRLGYDRLATWYRNFGFGSPTGIGLREEIGGIAPTAGGVLDPEAAKREAILLGIGQGHIQVTPLQLANAYATLLRGGEKMTPSLVESTEVPATVRIPLAVDQLPAVRQGLYLVVNGEHGTARKAFGMNIQLAGKTGTATAWRMVFDSPTAQGHMKQDDDAWFVGYVPADRPKYVIAALMEFGGHGGAAAAPMAKEAIIQLERHDYLPKLDVP